MYITYYILYLYYIYKMSSNFLILSTLLTLFLSSYSSSIDITSVGGLIDDGNWHQFSLFQNRFRRVYLSVEELEHRYAVFKDNLQFINSHNLDNGSNFTLGINQFADLTNDEYRKLLNFGVSKNIGATTGFG